MAKSIDFRVLDLRIQRLSAKKALEKNRKRGTLDEVRWINLFSGGQNDKFAVSKLLPDSNIKMENDLSDFALSYFDFSKYADDLFDTDFWYKDGYVFRNE